MARAAQRSSPCRANTKMGNSGARACKPRHDASGSRSLLLHEFDDDADRAIGAQLLAGQILQARIRQQSPHRAWRTARRTRPARRNRSSRSSCTTKHSRAALVAAPISCSRHDWPQRSRPRIVAAGVMDRRPARGNCRFERQGKAKLRGLRDISRVWQCDQNWPRFGESQFCEPIRNRRHQAPAAHRPGLGIVGQTAGPCSPLRRCPRSQRPGAPR